VFQVAHAAMQHDDEIWLNSLRLMLVDEGKINWPLQQEE